MGSSRRDAPRAATVSAGWRSRGLFIFWALVGVLATRDVDCGVIPQSGDSEKNFPIVEPPLYFFGRAGSGPGEFRGPAGLAIGADDSIYALDSGNHRIEVFQANGKLLRCFGSPGSGEGQFLFPSALALSPEGDLYVGDAGNGRIQVLSREGRFLRQWGGVRSPRGISFSQDRVYVTDGVTHELFIFSRQGVRISVTGGLGREPGHFNEPTGIAVDPGGFLYVTDTGNHRIQKLDPEGRPLAQWGDWGGQAGLLSYPAGLAYGHGCLFVADRANHRIQAFTIQGALIGQWGSAPASPGQGEGRLHFPDGVAVSPSGGLTVVSEPLENRIQVFANREIRKGVRVNDLPWWDSLHTRLHSARLAPPPPGAEPQRPGALPAADLHALYLFDISSDALGPLAAFGGYGRKLGELNGISGVAVDLDKGRAWVSDPGNRRLELFELNRDPRRPDTFSRGLRVIAGYALDRGVPPPVGENPARPLRPGPLRLDARGRLYLLDLANERILVYGDEFRMERSIRVPPATQGFAVGSHGEIWVTDPPHFRVQEIDSEGHFGRSFGRRDEVSDDGFLMPYGVAVDPKGFIYVTDALLNQVKKFDREGRFVKKWGKSGSTRDELISPRGVDFYPPECLVIEDFANHRAQAFDAEGKWLGTYVAGGLSTPLGIR